MARLTMWALSLLKPPPTLTVSQWADAHRVLSPEASSEPGRWSTARAEYQRGIMDAMSDPDVETVVVMKSAQVGWTEIVNNVVGFHIHQDPAPILVVQPTVEMAETWSKDRLAPMLRDSPVLREKVANPRARDSGNTLLHKGFAGGHLTMAGANSPAGLASRPIRLVLFDEVDRFGASAGAEGDPITLGRKRTTTFWNRKILMGSTPTTSGVSRIERAFLSSDRRRYHVPCPHCGHEQVLRWPRVKWPEGRPAEALYHCEDCGAGWSDAQRWRAVKMGRWIAEGEFNGVAGFHINELASTWRKLAETVKDFLDAKDEPEMLKAWVNTALGETWAGGGEAPDWRASMTGASLAAWPCASMGVGADGIGGRAAAPERHRVCVVGLGAGAGKAGLWTTSSSLAARSRSKHGRCCATRWMCPIRTRMAARCRSALPRWTPAMV
jgi:phage terminase large subunit GpA-like protein